MTEVFRIGAAAYAIETHTTSFRNWLVRGQVTLPNARYGEGVWVAFSVDDIAHLALVRVLVDFGARVDLANSLAHVAAAEAGKLTGKDADLISRWDGKTLLVHIKKLGPGKSEWTPLVVSGEPVVFGAFLTIRVSDIISQALERARSYSDRVAA